MKHHNYFVYITTNPSRKVLYTGMTNDLEQRIIEHYLNRGDKELLQVDIIVIAYYTTSDIHMLSTHLTVRKK